MTGINFHCGIRAWPDAADGGNWLKNESDSADLNNDDRYALSRPLDICVGTRGADVARSPALQLRVLLPWRRARWDGSAQPFTGPHGIHMDRRHAGPVPV